MDRKTKIIVIVSGSILVATALGVGIYFLIKKRAEYAEADKMDVVNPYLKTGGNAPTTIETNSTSQPLISAQFNSENELSNSLVQLKGLTLYPKEKAIGGWDYTNVRSSAKVNNDQGWWDVGNKVTTIYKGNPIGRVISETTGVHNGYSYRWFKVKLASMISGYSEGYVRADTVTFKSIL